MAQVVSLGLKLGGLYLASIGFVGASQILFAGSAAIDMADAREQRRRQRNQARDAFNASLTDRLEMVDITPDQARTMVLGRVRTVEGVRRRWVSGANSEKLTLIISFAGHEIDGFETFYFNDVPLTLDGSGYVLTEPFAKVRQESYATAPQALVSGGGSVVLPVTPTAGSVSATWTTGGAEPNTGALTSSVSGATVTVSGAPPEAVDFFVTYQAGETSYTARIRSWRGAPGQNVGADIAADYPAQTWLATAKFEGMPVAVVDLDYDPDVYPQGRPVVTALLRGARCYDIRKDSTAGGSGAHRSNDETTWEFTENPALHARRYALWAHGWALSASDLRESDIGTAAAVCDVSTTFTLRKPDTSTTTVTLPRYRCGVVLSSEGSPGDNMASILATMAGRAGWAGGVWRLRAGHMPTPVFAMDQTWLANVADDNGGMPDRPTLRIDNGQARENKVNRVSGKCIDPDQRWQPLPFPAIQDATLIAAEGETYAQEVEYQGVNHPAHAQHLGSIAIRRAQASFVGQFQCNLSAFDVELFDVGTLSLPAYGISGKTVECASWRWSPTEGVSLTLPEITQAIYDPLAELKGRDPAPNTTLPRPWDVEQLTGLVVTSGTVVLSDSSILVRTQVEWDAPTQQSVRAGGRVQIQYAESAPSLQWQLWEESAAASSAVIPGLRVGRPYVFRARFLNAPPFNVAGDWSVQVLHSVAQRRAAFVYLDEVAIVGLPGGTGFNKTQRSFSLTPERDCQVEFTATLVGSNVYPDAGLGVWWTVQPYAGSEVTLGTCDSDSTARQTFVCAAAFDAVGGVPLTFSIKTSAPLYPPTAPDLRASAMRVGFVY